MPPKQKILLLIEWFLPGYKAGGPIQSCVNMCRVLKDNYDVYVFTTDTDHGTLQPYQGLESNKWLYNAALGINIYYGRKKTLSASQVASEIRQVDADYIYLNLMFSPLFVIYPLWLKWRGNIKAKMVLCPRGSLYESALNLKRYKKIPLLRLYRWIGIHRKIAFHATNSREEKAIQKYFPGAITTIANNLPNMHQLPFETCPKKQGSVRCIFIARIVAIKNLLFMLDVLSQVTANVQFSIVGHIEDSAYWEQCEHRMAALPKNISCRYEGPVKNEELPALIQQHHLFVLPTTGENFGHAILEALLAGRPVLISDQTPWLHLESQGAGWDIPLGQKERFVEVMEELAGMDQAGFDRYALHAWQFANRFIHQPNLVEPYYQLFS